MCASVTCELIEGVSSWVFAACPYELMEGLHELMEAVSLQEFENVCFVSSQISSVSSQFKCELIDASVCSQMPP